MTQVLSFDIGASNGRLVRHYYDGKRITSEIIHRFDNKPIVRNENFHWDFAYLMDQIYTAIRKAQSSSENAAVSVGFDTWGVDFGVIDQSGNLLFEPYSYRDDHTFPYMEEVLEKDDKFNLFKLTGNEVSSINTLFQVKAIVEKESFENAAHLLMMPTLLQYQLTGIPINEFTICSTTQMLQLGKQEWNTELLDRLLDRTLPLTEVRLPHQVIGPVSNKCLQKEGIAPLKVVLTPGHDTACALSALPMLIKDSFFMSIGTWTIIGTETEHPIVTSEAFEKGFTNEGTSEGTYRFQNNSMGFWIMQELRREWKEKGHELDFEAENQLVKNSGFSKVYIDPNADVFFNPSSMIQAIEQFCLQTDQRKPETIGETLRCVWESMALSYAHTIQGLEKIVGYSASAIYAAGGGIKNTDLCQFISDATGKLLITGPVESSSLGNGLSQLRALGKIASLQEGREVISRSVTQTEYEPKNKEYWSSAMSRFNEILEKK
ncbi:MULTISPECIES: rhamnulokinase family protein [unclassified Sporosarcina]|uniref:rhamnulokinase n=1 Tax=unclassified Sporosarcina TaxID=2647733 RepID=UPI00203C5508|nr:MULTISPECIES: FGGY-family carbohydrate kinase [unclassified Sporosarcina]GKV65943.1 L-fuculose kinase [Sporosarcina sp. NCCP-2331]GLB56057.1 L-fuculose kinase [Sporosarcina sp. NCCP-2378]